MIKIQINKICAKLVECEPLTSGMIGKTLEVEFSADWAGLSKTAVFSNGNKTINVLESEWNGNAINIPWEVLETPNRAVSFGIYGYTKNGDDIILAIPTLYTSLGRVYLGVDPDGDESTEPSLPVWAQIQTEVDDLDDRVTYLEEHGGGSGLPEVTEADNGKVLKVIDGEWAKGNDEGGIPDAPSDGKQYARKDGAWSEVESGGYEPPIGGIPKTDLASAVQTSLDKADSAVQQSDLTPYAKTTDIPTKTSDLTNDSGFLDENDTEEAEQIEIDTVVTENSTNLITSGAVFAAIGDVEAVINAIRGVS